MLNNELFKRLKYNVVALPESKQVFKVWPELGKIKEFKEVKSTLDQDKVLRYILLMYDRDTPLNDIQSVHQRKMQAAELVGFKKDTKGRFDYDVIKLFECTLDPTINSAILRFSRMHKSSLWETLVTIQEVHYRNQRDILNGSAGDKFTSKDLHEEAERLDSLRAQIINNDTASALGDSLHDYVQQELQITPEAQAERIMNGERVVDIEPYKKD